MPFPKSNAIYNVEVAKLNLFNLTFCTAIVWPAEGIEPYPIPTKTAPNNNTKLEWAKAIATNPKIIVNKIGTITTWLPYLSIITPDIGLKIKQAIEYAI